jgi:hypothetical protein
LAWACRTGSLLLRTGLHSHTTRSTFVLVVFSWSASFAVLAAACGLMS